MRDSPCFYSDGSRAGVERGIRFISKYFMSVVRPELFLHEIHTRSDRIKWKARRAKRRLKKQEARRIQRQGVVVERLSYGKEHGRNNVSDKAKLYHGRGT